MSFQAVDRGVACLEGNTRRAIDIHEGEQVDAHAFKALVQAAVAGNGAPPKKANAFRVFTDYVKLSFFAGTSLRPVPPGGTPKGKASTKASGSTRRSWRTG